MRLSLISILFLASCALLAQDASFTITDKSSGEPIEFVHIIYKGLSSKKTTYNTTNIKGKAANIATEASAVTISFIGYENIRDTIQPGKSYTYQLTPGSEGLEEVVLTAQYAPVSESNSVFKVKVINQDFISKRGAINVNEVLNTQLNIRIQQDGVLGSGLEIQGLGGENVKILIDGVPIVGRLDGQIDLSQINMNNVERIEVIEGPMSVNYGSNALAGAINIITKNPGKQEIAGSVYGLYESIGTYNVGASLNVGGKKSSFLVDGGRNFFEGWSQYDSTRSQEWNQKEQYFGQLKYNHDFKNLTMGIGFNGLWEQIIDRGERDENVNYTFDNWFTTQRYITSLDLKFAAGPFKNSQILASYTYYKRNRDIYRKNLVTLDQTLTGGDTTLVNNYMTRGTFATARDKNWNYQLGFDVNAETGSGARISEDAGVFLDAAIFGSLQWTPTIRWSIQPGVRVAYNNNYPAPIVPSLHIRYNLTENSLIRFSYSHGFRAPSIKELYLDFFDVNHQIYGNPDLEAENSRNVNLSYIYRTQFKNGKQTLKIEPALFYNHIYNMIQLLPTGINELSYTYQNFAEYETFGGKIEANYSIHPDFSFGLGGSILGYTNEEHEELENTPQYIYTPEINASFSYWRASKKFSFNVNYKYTGVTTQYFWDEETEEIMQSDVSDYGWLDITVTQKLWQNKLELGAGIKNVLDVTNLNVSAQSSSSGTAHSSNSGSRLLSFGRTWFIRCNVKI